MWTKKKICFSYSGVSINLTAHRLRSGSIGGWHFYHHVYDIGKANTRWYYRFFSWCSVACIFFTSIPFDWKTWLVLSQCGVTGVTAFCEIGSVCRVGMREWKKIIKIYRGKSTLCISDKSKIHGWVLWAPSTLSFRPGGVGQNSIISNLSIRRWRRLRYIKENIVKFNNGYISHILFVKAPRYYARVDHNDCQLWVFRSRLYNFDAELFSIDMYPIRTYIAYGILCTSIPKTIHR